MAQDHGLCRKKVSQQMDRCTGRHCRPVLQLPTGQSCSLQTVGLTQDDPGAHGNEQMAKQNEIERGQEHVKGSGHGRQSGRQPKRPAEQSTAGKHSLLNKATAGRHSQRILRPAQASQQTASSWPALQQTQQLPDDVVLPCS